MRKIMPQEAIVRSQALEGTTHGFATRAFGTLVDKWGANPQKVAENRLKLATAAGFHAQRLFTATQVHADFVYEVRADDTPDAILALKADALITRLPQTTLAVATADCVPILMRGAGVVAAVHAGWRGTVSEIGKKAVAAMALDPQAISAAIGPSICAHCYEVGEDVAQKFADEFVRRDLGPKPHVDLQLANAAQLRTAGVGHVEMMDTCTQHEPKRFFSFRREQTRSGLQLSFIHLGPL